MKLFPLPLVLLAAFSASAQDRAASPENSFGELILALDDDRPELRDAAEAELRKLGNMAGPAMRAALSTASPETRVRLERILTWTGPGWGEAAERTARAAWETDESLFRPSRVHAMTAIPMEARALKKFRDHCRLFRVVVPDATAVTYHIEIRVVWRDGTFGAFDAAGAKRLFALAALIPDDEGRAAVAAFHWLLEWQAHRRADIVPEDRRLEVCGNEVVYRRRVLELSESGASWTGDFFMEFREGTLDVVNQTQLFDNAVTDEKISRLLDRGDPWLEIAGHPPERWRDRIAEFTGAHQAGSGTGWSESAWEAATRGTSASFQEIPMTGRLLFVVRDRFRWFRGTVDGALETRLVRRDGSVSRWSGSPAEFREVASDALSPMDDRQAEQTLEALRAVLDAPR